MTIKRGPIYSEYAGTDLRIAAVDREGEMFHSTTTAFEKVDRPPFVEVQAFRSHDTAGVNVSLTIWNAFGNADVMLSAAEARDVAIALIEASAQADAIDAKKLPKQG